MYGEMSQQQSTKAKLDAQGGAAGAASVDVMDAQIKAKTQQDVLDAQLKEGDAKDGLKSSAEDLSKAADKLAQTAGTLAGGKTAADIAGVSEYKSPEDYIAAQKRDSIDKATKSRIMSDMANNQDAKQNVIDEELKQIRAAKGDKGVENYLKEGSGMGFVDEKGNAASNADEWVRGRSTFSASGMNKNEQGVIAGARVSTAFNALTGEAITNVDGVRKIEDGTSTNAHLGDSGNIESQRTREGYEHIMNPMSKGLPMLVGKTHDAAKEYFESKGINEDDASSLASLATGGGAAVTAAGIVEVGTRIKNSVMGNHVATESFEYDTGKINADEKPIMKRIEKGEHFSTKQNSALGDYIKNHDVSKVERGVPGKIMGKMVEKADDLKSTSSPSARSNETVNESTNSQDSSPDSSGNNKANNQVQHSDNPPSKDTSSIPNDTEKVKPSVSEEIDAQKKNMDKLNNSESFKADRERLNTQYSEQVRLNGGETPEMASRHAGDMANLQDSHLDKISKHETALAGANTDMNNNRFAKPNKNFKRLTAIANSGKALGEGVIFGEVMSDAPKHSMNEGNYNMARLQAAPNNLISGAMTTVMSSVASAGNVLDTINPLGNPLNSMSNKYLGTNLSTASTQLLNQSANSFGNAWRNVSNIGSGSHDVAGYSNTPQSNTYAPSIHNPVAPPVPQHAQTAFSTQPMAYTSAAMSDPGYNPADSKNAYGDTTNVANTGAASYRTDSTQESLDRQEDTSLGIEYMQEETSRAADASEKLLETIYSNNQVKKQSRYNE